MRQFVAEEIRVPLPPSLPERAAEADHRIANSLQMVSARIAQEMRGAGAEGQEALLRTQAGILAIAEMHRLLQQPGPGETLDVAA